jgi:hypothetical protein
MFFIVASLVVGSGVYLISPAYAYETTGTLFILSTLSVAWQFFQEFGGK